MRAHTLSRVAALALAALSLTAFAQDKKGVTPGEMNYQAGASPLGNEPMVQSTNPKAPAMTTAEFDVARKIYFERCAGCHGVLRKGATGKPLTPDLTVAKGTDYLKFLLLTAHPQACPTGKLPAK